MEAIVISLLTSAAGRVFTELETMIGLKKHNSQLIRDIEEFRNSLKADLSMVEKKRQSLRADQFWAIESLSKDLEDASSYLEQCRNQGRFSGMWNAKTITSELAALRNRLSHNFQVKLFFTNLEVLIDTRKLTGDIQSKLGELLTRSANHSDIDSSTNEIKALLKPLTLGQKVQERKVEELRAEIRTLSGALGGDNTSTSDTEKFLGDILNNLAVTLPSFHRNEDEIEYYDVFTAELMYDPVKCNDGRTYDRFSVFQHNQSIQIKPLIIVIDDLDVRSRLFEKFAHTQPEKVMRSRRSEYRTEAVATAKVDDFGEALERLDNVLQWDPYDDDCLRERDRMRDMYRKEALRLPVENGNYNEILDMLQVAQKWSPSDKAIFDKLAMIRGQQSGTSQTGLQPQLRIHEILHDLRSSSDTSRRPHSVTAKTLQIPFMLSHDDQGSVENESTMNLESKILPTQTPAHVKSMNRSAEARSGRSDHERENAATSTGQSYHYRAEASTVNNGDSHRELHHWEAAERAPKSSLTSLICLDDLQLRCCMGTAQICDVIIAIIFPSLGVFFKYGCVEEFWICVLLTIFGYIPGIVYALYVVL